MINDFVMRDEGHAIRQAHLIDAHGNSAAHTGAQCVDWAGHVLADGVSVAGNMLAGADVIHDTLACYLDNKSLSFEDGLLLAMKAGEAAGGDQRGKQAAALRVHYQQDYPMLDLSADDHADPLTELSMLYKVAQERLVHFAHTFATAQNFSGTTDRTELDKFIAKREAQWRRDGVTSESHATPL